MLHHSAVATKTTTAYRFGVRDAEAGKPCEATKVFAQPKEQAEYEAGHAAGNASVAKAIVTPQLKRNIGREYTRRTDNDVETIFKAAQARCERIGDMIAKTAMLSPEHAGDILWA
jgi:hypothetical protein